MGRPLYNQPLPDFCRIFAGFVLVDFPSVYSQYFYLFHLFMHPFNFSELLSHSHKIRLIVQNNGYIYTLWVRYWHMDNFFTYTDSSEFCVFQLVWYC
jgi:hypothetical protein